ncbi:MAG TPA: PAS domain S-box protein, partial [Bacteroidota bacterium]|nr:PAS domain S-box protein [Bacteroidota bacterium]
MKKPVRRSNPKKRIAIDDLSDNRELFRLITENVSDLIAVLDRDGRRIYNNPSYRNTLGEPESLLGTNSFIEIHPDDRERIKKIFQETLRSGIGQKAEFRFLRNDVTIRYVESQGNVIKDRDGNITNVVVVSRDITERKEVEHQLHLLAHALTCTRDCFFIIDINGIILFVNNSLCDTYGYSEEELQGKNVSLLISPNNSSETLNQILAATLKGGWTGEIMSRRNNGEDFPVELRTSVVINSDEEPAGYVGVAHEITARKRSEKIQSAIYKISEATNTTDDLQDLYKSIHSIVGELMSANNFYIALYDEQKGLLHFPYFIDEIDPPYPPKKLGKGLTEYVLRTGEPLLATPDIFKRLVESKDVESIGAPSIDWLGVPLKTKVKTIGVLVVQTYTEGIRYRETEKNILMFVASQIAMAIERKRIESALRVSEQKLRTIIEHSTNLFYSHTTEHVLTYASSQTRQFFDCEPDEALIRWTEFATDHPGNAEGYALTQRAIDSGIPQRPYELELVGKKGRKIWVEVHESPVVIDGKTTAIVGSLTDITEWKKTEEALHLQTFYFRQLFENSPSAIVLLDKTNVILDVNSAFQQIFQYTINEAKGKYIDDLIVPEFLKEEGQMISEISLTGKIIQKETVRKRKDDSLVDVNVTGYPIMLNNQLMGIYGIYVDVSERKRLEEHLRQAQKMESLGTIAGGIAHDFNNILNIILGHISLLHSGTVPPEKIKQSLETIYKAAQRGSGLVKQILTFARKTDVQIETLEINKMIEELGHLIQETFPKTITLITEL